MELIKFIRYRYRSFIVGFVLTFLAVLVSNWLILYLTTPKVPIFGFQGIADTQNIKAQGVQEQKLGMEYSKQDIAQFLDYLVQNNFWFLSSQELYEHFIDRSKPIPSEHIGQKPIMLSFDQSYKGYYTILLPILENLEKTYKKKVKVVLFLNSGLLAKDQKKNPNYLVCGDLREGLRKGFYDIQSHGQSYKDLTQLNLQELIYELSEAKKQLIKCTEGLDTNKTVASHIAYPLGTVNQQVEVYVSRYYSSGYLYNSRMLRLGWLKTPYQIPRLAVNAEKSPSKLIREAEMALKITEKGVKN